MVLNKARLIWRGLLRNHPRTQPSYLPRKGLRNAIAEFSKNGTGKILDIGCGCKPYQQLFTMASSYTGIDTRNSGHSYWNNDVVDIFYDGRNIPFEASSFDTIVSFQVLEHVKEIDGTMHEIRRVLRNDGVFIGTIPFIWPEHEMPYDYQRWTVEGIQRMLALNGFQLIHAKKIGGAAEVLSALLIDRLGCSSNRTRAALLIIISFIVNSGCDLYRWLRPVNEARQKQHSFYLDIIFFARKFTIHDKVTPSRFT